MINYMKQYLEEVDHDVKVRFQVAVVGFIGLCLSATIAVVAVMNK